MRIKLLRPRTIDVNGTTRHFQAGEWVDVRNKRMVQHWIAKGIAVLSDAVPVPDGAGVVVADVTAGKGRYSMPVSSPQDDLLPYALTALVAKKQLPSEGGIARGLSLVARRWEIAVPLFDYKILACHVGSQAERDKTKAIIRDLRVPLRDCDLIFVRRGTDGEQVVRRWWEAKQAGGHPQLAFLRALYEIKPIVLDLPWGYENG